MRQEWSSKWKSSVQPRKQRKFRHNAPLHARRSLMSANISKPLRERFGRRSIAVRKGDEVSIMRGSLKGTKGIIEKVDLRKEKVYIEGVKGKKVDGSDVARPVAPSNLMITKLSLDDKKRQAVLERSGKETAKKPVAQEKAKESRPSGGHAAGKKEKKKAGKADKKAKAVKQNKGNRSKAKSRKKGKGD